MEHRRSVQSLLMLRHQSTAEELEREIILSVSYISRLIWAPTYDLLCLLIALLLINQPIDPLYHGKSNASPEISKDKCLYRSVVNASMWDALRNVQMCSIPRSVSWYVSSSQSSFPELLGSLQSNVGLSQLFPFLSLCVGRQMMRFSSQPLGLVVMATWR